MDTRKIQFRVGESFLDYQMIFQKKTTLRKENTMLLLRSKKIFLTLGCALTTMLGLQAAAQEGTSDAGCQRCKAKPRPAEKEHAIYQEMSRIANNTARILGAKSETREDIVKTFVGRSLCSSKKAVAFPSTMHLVKELSPNGDLITIQDGSGWTVREKDFQTVQSWHATSEIAITPNWLSLWGKITRKQLVYKYRITNLATKENVEANLSVGPFRDDAHTLRIRRIEKERGQITFTNGTMWHYEPSRVTNAIVGDWRVGHYIIPATNNTWFGLSHNDIIINVSTDNWMPASRIH